MHLNQRIDGVWISDIPVRFWTRDEPASLTDKLVHEVEFISQSELEKLSSAQKTAILELDLTHLYLLGVACDTGNYYIVFIWNAGYLFRKKAKLSACPFFHLPLIGALNTSSPNIDQFLRRIDTKKQDAESLDHFAFALLHSGRLDLALQAAISLCEKAAETEKGWLRLGDIGFKMGSHKLAMLAYGRMLHLSSIPGKLLTYCVERITLCSEHTEWGQVFLETETAQIPTSLSSGLLAPWTSARLILKNADNAVRNPTLQRDMRARMLVPVETGDFAPLPPSFQWIVPFQLAVSSAPLSEAEIKQLDSPFVGVKHVVSLDDWSSPEATWFHGKSIKHTTIPIPDFCPPSIEQVDCIMDLLVNPTNLPALIHCAAGLGRTGTIVACYLAAFGFQVPAADDQMPVMQASEAITALRSIRPGSIETLEQEELIPQWVNTVWKRKSILRPTQLEPPPCPLELVGDVPTNADLLILVGLQGRHLCLYVPFPF